MKELLTEFKYEFIIKDTLAATKAYSEKLNSIMASLVRLFRTRGFRIEELEKVIGYIVKQGDQILSVAECNLQYLNNETAAVYKTDIALTREMLREKAALVYELLQKTSSLGEDLITDYEENSNV